MSSSPEDSHLILPSSDQIHIDGGPHPPSPDDDHHNLCLGWMGKCGDYKNKLLTSKHIIKLIQKKYYFIEKIDIEEYYNHIFNKVLNNLKIDLDKLNQFAFIIFIKKDGTLDTEYPEVYKPNLKHKKHSEDYIFDLLKEILDKNDCLYKEALIFSFNSPCLARPTFKSCSDQAIDIAQKLYENHGMKMIIGFYNPWGINGSYESILPYKPLKDCTYTFKSQTLGSIDIIISNKTTKKKKREEVENKLLESIYKKYPADLQNKAFSMEMDNIDTPEYNLEKYWSKIKNPQNKERFDQIVSHLFEHPALNKTFDDFKNHGLEKFYKCMKDIYHLLIGDNANLSDCLIDDYDANSFNILIDDLVTSLLFGDDANLSDCLIDDFYLYEEIRSYLQNIFFPWWAKKVEDASSRFLNKEISYFLQESAVCHFLRDLKKVEHYFVIGYVKQI